MARSLFTAKFWHPLVSSLAQEIEAARRAHSRATIAVPSQAAKHWLLRHLARELGNDLAGLQILTLHQLALDILLKKEGAQPEVSEDKRYLFAVWQMMQAAPDTFPYPKNDPYPTVRRIYSALRELRDAGVTLEEAEWLAGAEPYEKLNAREEERARKIFNFYAGYLKILDENSWMDGPAMMMKAAAEASALSGPLLIWGFYEMMGVQKIFLKGIAENSPDISIFIPEHEFTQILIQEIQGWGFGMVKSPESEAGSLDSKTVLFSCPTAKEEAWAIAKMLRFQIQQGASPSECAVIFRQSAAYFTSLERALSENGIPFVCAEDPAGMLSAKPLGAALKSAIAFWESPSASTAAEMLERCASPVEEKLAPYIEPLTARFFSLSRAQMGNMIRADHFEETVLKLAENEGSVPREIKIEVSREAARFLTLCWEGIEAAQKPSPASLLAWLKKSVRAPHAQDFKTAMARFSEMIESLSPRLLQSRSFAAQILLENISSIELDGARNFANTGGVWLLTANQARGGAWRHVFLCGLTEGNYPLEMKEDPFLSEAARARLNRLGFSLKTGRTLTRFKEPARFALEDELLFELLCRGAREFLTLSFPQLDAQSKPLLPSPYLAQNLEIKAMPSSAWQERLRFLHALYGENAGLLLTVEERACEKAFADGIKAERRAAVEVPEAQWRAWLNKPERFSPTYLSDFLACPQAFHWKQFMRLPGEPRIPQKEFFPPIFLGQAFSETLVESLKRHQSLKELGPTWRKILTKEFPALELSSLCPSERYKMRRIEGMLSALESEWTKTWPGKSGAVEAEKVLSIALGDSSMYARADAVLNDGRYFEFKLKRRSIFKSSGKRTKPLGMLENLLDPEAVEGPQYGLQVLYYLLDAQKNSGSSATLLNAFWEIESGKSAPPPIFYTWNVSEDLSSLKTRLAQWIALYAQGASHEKGSVLFPFWPHEKQGKRCGGCSYQTLCLKDSAPVRAAHERWARPLINAFSGSEEETVDA